jgi:hypothetical protein
MPLIAPDPHALDNLVRAHEALKEAALRQEAEAKAAYRKTMDAYAADIARYQAVVYQLVAECHEAGFSSEEINRQLYGTPHA